MADPDTLAVHEHPDHIEPVGVGRSAMARHPDAGRTTELPLFSPVDGLYRAAEPIAAPSLDLDEGDHPLSLDHQIDVPVPAAEPPLDHAPAPSPKPPLRYPLAQLSQCLRGR